MRATLTIRWRLLLRRTGRIVLFLLGVIVGVTLLLLIPSVQTWCAHRLGSFATERMGAEVRIGRVALRPFGPIVLEDVFIGDQVGDTLVTFHSLEVTGLRIAFRRNLIQVSSVALDRPRFKLATRKGDAHSNLTNLLNSLGSGDTTAAGEPWKVRCTSFRINDFHFSFHDDNYDPLPFGVDFDHVEARQVQLNGHHLLVAGDSIGAHIVALSLREQSSLHLDQLAGAAQVSPRGISIDQMILRTPDSDLRGELRFITDDWSAYDSFVDRVTMRLQLDSSRLEFADVALFAPDLQGVQFPIDVQGRFRGTVTDLKGRDVTIGFGERSIFRGSAELSGLPDWANTFMLLDVDELRTDPADLATIPVPPFTDGGRLQLPAEVGLLGDIAFSGNFTGFPRSFTAYGTTRTELGILRTDLSYERDTLSNVFGLSGRLATDGFIIGPLLQADVLGPMAASIRLNGSGRSLARMTADLQGTFPYITVSGTRITGITANGRLEPNRFNGSLKADDQHLVMDFKGLVDFSGRWPEVDFKANVQHADLTTLGIAYVKGYNSLSVLVEAKGRLAPDSLSGTIEARSISYCDERGEHDLGDLHLFSGMRSGENLLQLRSTFADAEIVGRFLPTRLPDVVTNMVFSVFPSLSDQVLFAHEEQQFRFELVAREAGPVLDLFVPGLSIEPGSTFRGSLDSRTFDLSLSADVPSIDLGALHMDDLHLIVDKTLDVLAFRIESDRQSWKDSLWIGGTWLHGKAYQDDMEFSFGWDTSSTGTNGELVLLGEVRGPRSLGLDLMPSHLYFGRGDWITDRPVHIDIDSSTVRIDSLVLRNADQRLAIDGTISRDSTLALAFDLANLRLENLTPLLDGPDIHGILHGEGRLFDLYGAPYVLSDLLIDSLSVSDKPVGDLEFAASWVEEDRAIDLNGTLTRGPIKALDFSGQLALSKGNALDLDLIMDRFDLSFMDPYLPEGLSNIQGQVTGTLDVTGSLDDPQVNGMLDLVDAGLKIDYLNTLYRFTHRVQVSPDMLALDLVTLRDEEGNTARIGGTILHQGLKDWNFNVWGSMDELLVLNTTLAENELYYGKAYATGDIEVSGYAGNMEIVVDARSAPGTDIHFPLGGSTEVSPIGFVHFLTGDSLQDAGSMVDLSGITLDLKVAVTPDAHFELIFDPTVGDILSGRGRGNMEMTVTQTGEFAMRGQVEVTEGEYLFTLRNVVNKRFQLEPGGRITWYGDPFDAILDLHAVYRLRAPLYDIMFEKNDAYRKRVPVEVAMHLRDKLLNPEIQFNVRLPSVDESVRTQVNSVMSTEQEMNRQVFALIVLNRFVQPPNYGGQGQPGGSGVAGTTTSELLSNQVSNWLSKLSNDFDLGVNYRPGDNITQDELEVAVSTQLFDERLLLTTNVGVQYGAQTTQNANTLVGDFQLEYLLNPEGRLRLKAFSVSNDRNLNRADQAPTTQGAGVAYREEFDNWREFWQKVLNVFRSDAKDRKFD